MPLSDELLGKLRAQHVVRSKEALERLDRLADFCPVYRTVILQHPEYFPWLENPANRDEQFRFGAFQNIWKAEFERSFKSPRERLSALQRFRRKMSLRIAYRDINGLADITDSLTELSLLAEFCLQSVTRLTRSKWEENLGQPWNDEENRPARFCILGLGKLGGGELNFCSDIDIYQPSGAGLEGPLRRIYLTFLLFYTQAHFPYFPYLAVTGWTGINEFVSDFDKFPTQKFISRYHTGPGQNLPFPGFGGA